MGLWHIGVPPSGPMDALAFRLANALVGNDSKAAGLQITLQGGLCVTLHHLTPCLHWWSASAGCTGTHAALKPPKWHLWDKDALLGSQQGLCVRHHNSVLDILPHLVLQCHPVTSSQNFLQ